jgi:hypothetical protein
MISVEADYVPAGATAMAEGRYDPALKDWWGLLGE